MNQPHRCRIALSATICAIAICSLMSTSRAATLPHILVADFQLNRIGRYDVATGASLGTFASVPKPNEMLVGPDGLLYVTSSGTTLSSPHSIIRFDPATGQNLGEFATNASLRGFDFGPNGNLFAADVESGAIVEFDRHTGANLGSFVSGLADPVAVRFGPDGDLYVARGHHQTSPSFNVLRFDGLTGASKGVFASAGIQNPQNLLFGPDGSLYVANQLVLSSPTENVTRYNGLTGELDSSFTLTGSTINPQGLAFLPDGQLLVGTGSNSVRRYNATTGAYIDDFIQGGMLFSGGVVLVPEPSTCALAAFGAIGLLTFWRRRPQVS
jgi:glucose/arabinose dehydrogenase